LHLEELLNTEKNNYNHNKNIAVTGHPNTLAPYFPGFWRFALNRLKRPVWVLFLSDTARQQISCHGGRLLITAMLENSPKAADRLPWWKAAAYNSHAGKQHKVYVCTTAWSKR